MQCLQKVWHILIFNDSENNEDINKLCPENFVETNAARSGQTRNNFFASIGTSAELATAFTGSHSL